MSGITPVQSADVQSSRFERVMPKDLVLADKALREEWVLLEAPGVSAWLQWSRFVHRNETGVPALGVLWIVLALVHRRLKNNSWKSTGFNGLTTVVGLALSDFTSSALKDFWDRPKPFVPEGSLAPFPLSFPSNHSTNIAFFCTWIALVWVIHWPKSWRLWGCAGLFTLTVGVGLSRIWLGQHYPLDVLAGWGLGSCLGFLFWRAHSLWLRR